MAPSGLASSGPLADVDCGTAPGGSLPAGLASGAATATESLDGAGVSGSRLAVGVEVGVGVGVGIAVGFGVALTAAAATATGWTETQRPSHAIRTLA